MSVFVSSTCVEVKKQLVGAGSLFPLSRSIALLVKCLLRLHKIWVQLLALHNGVAHTSNSSIGRVEAGGLEVQSYLRLSREGKEEFE